MGLAFIKGMEKKMNGGGLTGGDEADECDGDV